MIVQIYDIHTVRYFYLVKIVRSTNTVRSYRRKSITGGKFHQYDQASQWWEGT
jgi:hypothetical protein